MAYVRRYKMNDCDICQNIVWNLNCKITFCYQVC